MARFWLAASAVLAAISLARCGSSDMQGSRSTGSGDGGSGGVDAGSASDAGGAGDAGSGSGVDAGSGGGVDAGTGGGGGGGGDGGGGSTATCTQAAFPTVAARSYVIDPAGREAVSSAADGSGTLLLGVQSGGSGQSSGTAHEAALVPSPGKP